MAYYCKKCGQYHYPSSKIGKAHKVHASQRHVPKETVSRTDKIKTTKKKTKILDLFRRKNK